MSFRVASRVYPPEVPVGKAPTPEMTPLMDKLKFLIARQPHYAATMTATTGTTIGVIQQTTSTVPMSPIVTLTGTWSVMAG